MPLRYIWGSGQGPDRGSWPGYPLGLALPDGTALTAGTGRVALKGNIQHLQYANK